MNKDIISIVIPIYNVPEKFLRRCIESAMNQTYNNIEIILIDDGSTDKSGEICDEYSNLDNRIRAIHKKNAGLSAARNTGFKYAKGKWITFVDGDDWIEKDMCESIYSSITDDNIDMCFFGVYRDYGEKSTKMKYSYKDGKIYTADECKKLQEDVLSFNRNISCVYAKFFKMDYLNKFQIQHNEELKKGAEGIEFNLRAFENLNTALFVEKYYYHYIYNDESISSKCNDENIYFVIKCFKKIKEYILKSDNKERLLNRFYNRMLYVIITTAISGYFNPSNTEKYKVKKERLKQYLQIDINKETMEKSIIMDLDTNRKIILFFLKNNCFFIINIIACIRFYQKQLKKNGNF